MFRRWLPLTRAALCPYPRRPRSHNLKLFPASSRPKLSIWFVVNLWVFKFLTTKVSSCNGQLERISSMFWKLWTSFSMPCRRRLKATASENMLCFQALICVRNVLQGSGAVLGACDSVANLPRTAAQAVILQLQPQLLLVEDCLQELEEAVCYVQNTTVSRLQSFPLSQWSLATDGAQLQSQTTGDDDDNGGWTENDKAMLPFATCLLKVCFLHDCVHFTHGEPCRC